MFFLVVNVSKYALTDTCDNSLLCLGSQDNSDLNFVKTLPNDTSNRKSLIDYITLEYKHIWALFESNMLLLNYIFSILPIQGKLWFTNKEKMN